MNTSVWKQHTVADIFQSYFYSYYYSLKSILSKYTCPLTKLISICIDIIFCVGTSLPILGSYRTPLKVSEQFFICAWDLLVSQHMGLQGSIKLCQVLAEDQE